MYAPFDRLRVLNDHPVRPGNYVLYWMTSARRTSWSFALDHAIATAEGLRLPLIVYEPLRLDYPWASPRHHAFLVAGMRDNAAAFSKTAIGYYPFVEPAIGAARGMLAALAQGAAVVVADDHPGFFLPRMLAAASVIPARLEAIDDSGLLPLSVAGRAFPTAYTFRRHLQKTLRPHLERFPSSSPLHALSLPRATLPAAVTRRWPPTALSTLDLSALPLDTSVGTVETLGGQKAGHKALERFLSEGLPRYLSARNEPDAEGVPSGLSPWLHHGHVSAHEVVQAVLARQSEGPEPWTPTMVSPAASGRKEGWWGASPVAEAFLDQVVTWRELGFVFCRYTPDYDKLESLPAWALATLRKHAHDRRPVLYTPEQLAAGRTGDPLWNAAQGQLLREGKIHNYLRMVWGKKILEWTADAETALSTMVELNNRYALDGRDPNSYGGIAWVLGRFDRPWGPERAIFGTVRYMSSANTARKFSVKGYIARYRPE